MFDENNRTEQELNSHQDIQQERAAETSAAPQQSAPQYTASPTENALPFSAQQTTAQQASQQAVAQQAVAQQAVQPGAWQNAYQNTAYPRPAANANPYAARSEYSASYANGTARTSSPSQPGCSRPGTPVNTYVDADGYYHRSFTEHRAAPAHGASGARSAAPKREKKEKAHLSKGAVALLLIFCVLISGAAGFGGAMLANQKSGSSASSSSDYSSVSDQLVIHQVSVADVTESGTQLVDKSTDEITRDVADSVVEITTEVVQTGSFYGQYIAQGAGSGVIISEDGYLVTNNHVIEDASTITVTLRSGESYQAKLIGTDADEDIALLKIEADDLTVAVFGDSSTLEVGDKSVIIGNPLGTLGGSVTEGIVSALDRSIVIDGKTMHLMQTDAAINPGNSGGGMFNGQGELVGIVVAKSGGTSSGSTIDNIGFVIPINNVLNILGDLKQYGYVRGKADTGMSFVDITNQMYAWYYYNSGSTGVYISSVERGSNAAEAGFQSGDRVISVDGKTVSSVSDLTTIISGHSAGDTIEFEVERSGRTGTISLTLEEYVPSTSR